MAKKTVTKICRYVFPLLIEKCFRDFILSMLVCSRMCDDN